MTLHEAERAFRYRTIRAALVEADGCRMAAAKALGLKTSYLFKLMRDLGITDVPPRERDRKSSKRWRRGKVGVE